MTSFYYLVIKIKSTEKTCITTKGTKHKKGMIKASIFYPNSDGRKFDMAYYCNKHIPFVSGLLSEAAEGATIESGLGGGTPGSSAPFVAM